MTDKAPANIAELKEHRKNFPGLIDKVYFNFGGQGPMPRAALDGIYKAHEFIQQQGPFSGRVNEWVAKETELTRAAIAAELGTYPRTITLTENVTVGCNIVLWGIDWQEGDRILITDCEHPGILAAVKEVARRFKLRVSTCPILATLNSGNPAVVIEQYLQPNTRLVVLSHVLWNTGHLLPLQEITQLCRDYPSPRPIQILVDAAQSVGVLPLNLKESGVHYYAFTGHKWLCGPGGVGGLYISPEAREELNPTFIGWRSVSLDNTGNPLEWQEDGRKYEVATSFIPLYTGLRMALNVHQQWGTPEERYQQILYNSAYLWQGLSLLPKVKSLRNSPPESGIISFRVAVDRISSKQLVQVLEQQNYLLRTIATPECIRACVHYLTAPNEIDQLVKIMASL